MLAIAGVLAGCGRYDAQTVALATRCMRESPDNRVKLSSSWLSDAEIRIEGDRVIVRAEIPVGIGLDAKIKFHHPEFECRREGNRLVWVGVKW